MVVSVGETVCVPDGETVPMPGEIETVVAPLVTHCSTADPPLVILSELALKLFITGALMVVTVTMADFVTSPALLAAVMV